MKKSNFILLSLFFFMITGCQKNDDLKGFIQIKETCNLESQEIITVKNAIGTLVYKDNSQGNETYGEGYFIMNSDIEEVRLPLKICNFPANELLDVKQGKTLNVVFNGRIAKLPETVNATHTQMELKAIKTISEE